MFIDTEFTDFVDPQLISIGLVSEFGEEFYAEVPYQLAACSEFVHDTVIPLLEKQTWTLVSHDELYFKISDWLRIIRGKTMF